MRHVDRGGKKIRGDKEEDNAGDGVEDLEGPKEQEIKRRDSL